MGMLDILYAYAYNHRTVMGENNVESSWTIAKISSSLSWLQVADSWNALTRLGLYRRDRRCDVRNSKSAVLSSVQTLPIGSIGVEGRSIHTKVG